MIEGGTSANHISSKSSEDNLDVIQEVPQETISSQSEENLPSIEDQDTGISLKIDDKASETSSKDSINVGHEEVPNSDHAKETQEICASFLSETSLSEVNGDSMRQNESHPELREKAQDKNATNTNTI